MAQKSKANLTSTLNLAITDSKNKQNTSVNVRGILQDIIDSTASYDQAFTGFTDSYFTSGSTGQDSVIANNGSTLDATGDFSFAVNNKTIASGLAASAFNFASQAIGDYSFATGRQTQAIGGQSFTEGFKTKAIGFQSHAGGSNSQAKGDSSFVHGDYSYANGVGTIVLGNGLTGDTDNTVYVKNLNIGNIPSGTSILNLGLDIYGNVVTGSTGVSFSGTANYYSRFNTGGTITNGIIRDDGIAGVTLQGTDNTSLAIVAPFGFYYPSLNFYNNGGTPLGGISAYAGTLYFAGVGAPVTPLQISSVVKLPYLTGSSFAFIDSFGTVRDGIIGTGLALSSGGTLSITAATSTDVQVSGFSYNNANTFTIANNTGGTFNATFNIATGLTVSGLLSATTTIINTATTNILSANTVTVSSTSNLYGNIFTSFSGSTARIVEAGASGALSATKDLIDSFLSAGTAATLLTTTSNWNVAKVYTGTTITGTYQGQQYYDANYYFIAINDNDWIRLARA